MTTKKKEPVETFTLTSGKVAKRFALSSKDYFSFRKRLQDEQDTDLATKEMVMRSYLLDGLPITIDMLEDDDGLTFEDVYTLTNRLDNLFSQLQQKVT